MVVPPLRSLATFARSRRSSSRLYSRAPRRTRRALRRLRDPLSLSLAVLGHEGPPLGGRGVRGRRGEVRAVFRRVKARFERLESKPATRVPSENPLSRLRAFFHLALKRDVGSGGVRGVVRGVVLGFVRGVLRGVVRGVVLGVLRASPGGVVFRVLRFFERVQPSRQPRRVSPRQPRRRQPRRAGSARRARRRGPPRGRRRGARPGRPCASRVGPRARAGRGTRRLWRRQTRRTRGCGRFSRRASPRRRRRRRYRLPRRPCRWIATRGAGDGPETVARARGSARADAGDARETSSGPRRRRGRRTSGRLARVRRSRRLRREVWTVASATLQRTQERPPPPRPLIRSEALESLMVRR